MERLSQYGPHIWRHDLADPAYIGSGQQSFGIDGALLRGNSECIDNLVQPDLCAMLETVTECLRERCHRNRNPVYGIANARIGFKTDDGLFDLSLWARNLFDKHYFQTLSPAVTGIVTSLIGEPRTIGATLRTKL